MHIYLQRCIWCVCLVKSFISARMHSARAKCMPFVDVMRIIQCFPYSFVSAVFTCENLYTAAAAFSVNLHLYYSVEINCDELFTVSFGECIYNIHMLRSCHGNLWCVIL